MRNSSLYSIGHGNKDIDTFINELKHFEIDYLIDIRSNPHSKYNPQFNQKEADTQQGKSKRERSSLGKVFTITYKDRILSKFNFDNFIDKLDRIGASRVVLFCVEEKAEACHRSIVADKLQQFGYKITHL
ncbi:MAG: DUF488 family protein [Bacteroidales bacterium]